MWTACQGSEDVASWSHGCHSDAGMSSGGLHLASIITLHFAKKTKKPSTRRAPTLGLAAVGGDSGHCDSHLGFSATSLEHFLSQEETENPANLLTN